MNIEEVTVGKFDFLIPKGWVYEIEEGILSIYKNDGEGAIQVSHYDIPNDIKFDLFDEFYDFISENIYLKKDDYNFYNRIKKIKEGLLSIEIENEDRYFIFGMFFYHHSVLFVTYNCELEFRDKEKDIVNDFLYNLNVTN